MIVIPKKYVRLISWADFLIVLLFMLLFVLRLDLGSYLSLIVVFLLPVFLIVSGYIILNNKKLKHRLLISWLNMFVGFVYLFFLIAAGLSLFFHSIIIYIITLPLETIANSDIFTIIPLLSLFLLALSGFCLRRIGK